MSAPLLKNLRKLITEIGRILDGEDNVTVYIYISELPAVICLQMGKGEKEVVITIDEDGIDQMWRNTKTTITWWKQIKTLFASFNLNVVKTFLSVLSNKVSLLLDLALNSIVGVVGQKLYVYMCSFAWFKHIGMVLG